MLPLIVFHRPIRRRIRLAREEDKAVVTDIANYAFAPKDRTVWIQGAFCRSDRTIYVLEDDGNIEAFVILRPEGNAMRIDLIGTWKQGRGICRDLMSYVEYSTAANFTEIVAGTHSDNIIGQAFYKALGFTC